MNTGQSNIMWIRSYLKNIFIDTFFHIYLNIFSSKCIFLFRLKNEVGCALNPFLKGPNIYEAWVGTFSVILSKKTQKI